MKRKNSIELKKNANKLMKRELISPFLFHSFVAYEEQRRQRNEEKNY